MELTKEGPLSFVLFESPFTSVSTVSMGHPSPVSLHVTFALSLRSMGCLFVLYISIFLVCHYKVANHIYVVFAFRWKWGAERHGHGEVKNGDGLEGGDGVRRGCCSIPAKPT
jgi:hypothetical protein